MKWKEELEKPENQSEFSEVVHSYYKLSCMRVMQFAREKYKIPPDEIGIIHLAIFARILNECCYTLGAIIKNGMNINEIYSEEHLLNLVKVLNNEPLDPFKRTDIETDIKKGLEKFKEFIAKNASDFYA